ncbi:MAG: hypothetical protein TREMPRED_002176 [Tremellales sp. Tagirdzhanova-0007]|nr:MAG: hypothetical protein TREMPRED_002176 [Tremellales sp. Tagirdzhanova-0007]
MPRFVPANRVFPQTVSVPGYNHFLTPLRKLIFDYDPLATSHHGIRTYIRRSLIPMASENPDVEVLVRKLRRGQPALLRGHYVNGRDKVICANQMELDQIAVKVKLLLNSSGAKIKHLKNLTLEAPPGGESARGIWSALHDQSKPGGGYQI